MEDADLIMSVLYHVGSNVSAQLWLLLHHDELALPYTGLLVSMFEKLVTTRSTALSSIQ